MMNGWMGGAWSPWLAVTMFLQMVVSLAFVVAVIWGITRFFQRAQTPNPEQDRALTILRERYARGEIDEEEFQRMREILLLESTGSR